MVTTEAELTRILVAAKVYHRATWSDDWTELQNADSVVATETLAPSIGRASFTIRNGRMLLPGKAAPEIVNTDVESILGNYVKIEISMEVIQGKTEPEVHTWYGIATEARQQFLGTHEFSGTLLSTEDWFVTCHDFKWILGRKQITKSKVVENGSVIEIGRALVFNTPWGDEQNNQNSIGNFDASDNVFAEFFVTSSAWNSGVILDYLFDNYAPQNGVLSWKRSENETDPILWYEPIVPQQDRTMFEIINDCIPRRRGVSWTLNIDEENSEVNVVTYSFLSEMIDLPSGGTLPASQEIIDVDLTEQPHIRSMSRTLSKQEKYQQVRVVGERAGVVATFAVGTELVEGWSATDETAYKDAANNIAGYVNLTLSEKAQVNDSQRMSTDSNKVYTQFVLPDAFNGNILGETIEDYWTNGIRFEATLPLLSNYDYTNPASPTLSGDREGEFLRPFVVGQLIPLTSYESLDKVSSSSLLEHYGRGIDFACNVEMMRNRPGISVVPTAAPHVLAKTHFDPSSEEPSDYFPKLNFSNFEATLYFRLDSFCEGVYPETAEPAEHDEQTVLTINVGSLAKLDQVYEDTVLAVKDGQKVLAASTGYIRDDRTFCEDIARLAWIIYGTPRQSIAVTMARISNEIPLGSVIRKFKYGQTEPEINSTVTSITWDMSRGTTEIVTEYAELDIVGLI